MYEIKFMGKVLWELPSRDETVEQLRWLRRRLTDEGWRSVIVTRYMRGVEQIDPNTFID